jgi:hypothetical protein
MCFSVEASFSASIVLAIVGTATIKKATERSQLLFASIPLLFSFQQFLEGCVWLALENKQYAFLLKPATYIFLIFAQTVWPLWVSLSVLFLEKEETRKRILLVFAWMGGLLSACLLYSLFTHAVKTEIKAGHIHYDLNIRQWFILVGGMFYLLTTVFTLFISSVKKMPLLGITILTALIISKLFFYNYVISVWCFFAAIISSMIYFILKGSLS